MAGAASQLWQKALMGSAPMFLLVVPGLPISNPCPASCMSQDVLLLMFMVLINLPKLPCTAFLPTAPLMSSETLLFHTGAGASLCKSQHLLCTPQLCQEHGLSRRGML